VVKYSDVSEERTVFRMSESVWLDAEIIWGKISIDCVGPCEVVGKFYFGINWPTNTYSADPIGRAVFGVGVRPLASWNCGFESHRGHGCLL
jgi:hypothetical protein